MTASSGLSLEGVAVAYGDVRAVEDITLDADPGETIAVVGPSGCGKSTTLRAVAGLADVVAGTIAIGGRDATRLPSSKREVGLVPQNYAVFPHMSVASNIGYGLRARGMPAAERGRIVDEMLELTSLGAYAGRRPDQLSGGQRQRVALARALAISPEVLLLDEPLAALDPQLRGDIRRDLAGMLARTSCATLIVTHDQREALALGQRIAVMKDGHLVQFATAGEIWSDPADAFVADFLAGARLLAADVVDGDALVLDGRWRIPREHLRLRSTTQATPRVIVREGSLRVLSDSEEGPGTITAEVLHHEFAGEEITLLLGIGDTRLPARMPAGGPVPAQVRIGIAEGGIDLLIPEGRTPHA